MTRPPPPRSSRGRRRRADSLLGAVVASKYRLVEVIGLGGTGAVYRAEQLGSADAVALKLVHPDAEGFSLLAMRMEREALAGAHLRHPNIAATLDFGSLADGTRYLVTELVVGRTLRDVMKSGPVEMDRAAKLARQLCEALRACHARGVVHRDLKPLNVMVDERAGEQAKLIDFGLARIPARNLVSPGSEEEQEEEAPTLQNLTLHGLVFGTVAYMAPETAQGMAAVNERSDLYALGVILYELFTGVHPFSAEDPVDLFLQHRLTPPPPMRERAPKVVVHPGFEAIVMRLLAKRPEERFPDAGAVLEALDRAMAPAPHVKRAEMMTPLSSVLVDPPEPEAPAAGKRARRSLAALGLLGALAAAGVAAFVRADRPEPTAGPRPSVVRALATLPPVQAPPAPPSAHDAIAARFRESCDLDRWQAAADVLKPWLDVDDSALDEDEDWRCARQAALRAAFTSAPGVDRLFDAIAEVPGGRGIELLYDIVESQGGSRGATLAWAQLKRPEVRARLSPALAVAVDLRLASCREKPALFDRAGQVGDTRAHRVLGILGSPRCLPHRGECCWRKHDGLGDAMNAIEAREGAR